MRYGSAAIAVLAALTVFYLRTSAPKPIVFPAPGEVRLFDTDPYYHMRHARYAAAHFPHLQRWDPALYPAGTPGFYVGLWDITIAGASLIAGGGHATPELVERVSAWTPPVVGALSLLCMFWLGWVAVGPVAGAVGALFMLLAPGLFASRGLLGYPDHHVAEVFIGLLALAGLGRCLQRQQGENPPLWWRPAGLQALPLSLFIFTWLGAPIYLVLIGVALFLTATVDIARGPGAETTARAATRYALGLLVVLVPVWIVFPSLVMEERLFKQTLFAVVLLGASLPVYAWAARLLVGKGLPRPGVALLGVAAAAGLILVGYLFAPHGKELANQLLEVKTELVREQADVEWHTYFYVGGAPAAFALLAMPLALLDGLRRRDRAATLALVLVAAEVVLLWVRTHDYGYAASAYVGFLGAYAAVRLVLFFSGWVARAVVATIFAAAVILPIWPLEKVVPPQRDAEHLKGLMILDEGWVHALRWVRDHTPVPAHGIDTPIPPGEKFHHGEGDYGVLAFWDFGHYIAAIGERLPIASGGISGSLARWFLIENEDEAVTPKAAGIGPTDHIGYVMVDGRTANDFFMAALKMAHRELDDFRQAYRTVHYEGHELRLWTFAKEYPKTMIAKLYVAGGDGLAHFRLVYESPERSAIYFTAAPSASSVAGTAVSRRSIVLDPVHEKTWRQIVAAGRPAATNNGLVYDVTILPTVRVFEVVAGAVLDGYAEPDATVEATLDLRAGTAQEVVHYHRSVSADAKGHYLLTVAYPTDIHADTDVVSASPYVISSGGKAIGSARVGTEDVRKGSHIPVQ